MRRRTVHVSFGIVAAVFGSLAAWCAVQLHNAQRVNAAIATANMSATTHNATAVFNVPQAQLAAAIKLAQAGKFTAAMKAYKALLDAPDEVRLPALYDLGNLNMREALKNGQGEAQRALPLIELAKQSYRDELRSNPGDWDARYNLERALWLSPEYDDPLLQRNQAPVHAEHATSTVQGAKIELP